MQNNEPNRYISCLGLSLTSNSWNACYLIMHTELEEALRGKKSVSATKGSDVENIDSLIAEVEKLLVIGFL